MSQLDGLLLGAIAALVAAVTFLYFAGRKDTKSHGEAFEKQKKANDDLIERISKAHQTQEEEMQARHEKQLFEMANDHKKEMAGMVDRVIEAAKNDKEHDRDERSRILALAESLERRAQSGRGRGG